MPTDKPKFQVDILLEPGAPIKMIFLVKAAMVAAASETPALQPH
jgi:hypothetical protein